MCARAPALLATRARTQGPGRRPPYLSESAGCHGRLWAASRGVRAAPEAERLGGGGLAPQGPARLAIQPKCTRPVCAHRTRAGCKWPARPWGGAGDAEGWVVRADPVGCGGLRRTGPRSCGRPMRHALAANQQGAIERVTRRVLGPGSGEGVGVRARSRRCRRRLRVRAQGCGRRQRTAAPAASFPPPLARRACRARCCTWEGAAGRRVRRGQLGRRRQRRSSEPAARAAAATVERTSRTAHSPFH